MGINQTDFHHYPPPYCIEFLLVDAGVKYSKLMHGSSEFKVVAIAALALKTVEDSIETFQ